MRKILLVAIVAIPVLALVTLFGRTRIGRHNLELKAYFEDAQGLRPGAPVRLAGVEVGTVTSVRARPERRESPAEVVMAVNTSYELKIPNDSTVSLATAGVLGETFAEIDVQNASGPPVASGGLLKAKSADSLSTQQLMERLEQIAKQKQCEGATKDVAGRKK